MPLDRNSLFEAFGRIGRYHLFDLIHYITALNNDCAKIISYDKDFDNLEIRREEP
ncbi:TPA: hypothetical protein HA231_03240 [Candidatus Woesearchaeota archaeon]|nr:hypothetical protein [Candidatus Woesearchaeota archaeon]